ncbi:putative iron export ATP-binding protein FetA [Ruminiclostridium hungatei]|uniref:Putative iron export ATP-binding protein FetA n=1 Tax=Ruminiclostridium hungatei TaxID=48256 RepID=A0A1V4SKX9_RUMHU|nr:ATP-binding cassette domain-containing protein [Ruminiclostridium hungatei]OPX44548.1 putative iron export ATP-binding protein FetA [Ruminiclostridium hungatei]
MSLLEFHKVTYVHDNKTVLKNISVNVEEGAFIMIIGPSGSGKSALLKLSCNLISPTQGEISFKSKSLDMYTPSELRKSITYCFHTPYLFGDTVMENLRFPFLIRDLKVDEKRIFELFSLFRLSPDFIYKEVRYLSDGEKQRLSLARSLLFKPELLLLDEITSQLDHDNTVIVENVIKVLNDEGITILWVTNSPGQMRRHASSIISMAAGEIARTERK